MANGHGGKREGAGRKPDPTKQAIAEAYTQALADEVEKARKQIIAALISRAKTGDISAIKEIHERLLGKVKETHELMGRDGEAIMMTIDLCKANASELLGYLTATGSYSVRVQPEQGEAGGSR